MGTCKPLRQFLYTYRSLPTVEGRMGYARLIRPLWNGGRRKTLCCGRKGGRRHRDTETELQSERGFVEKVDTHRGKPVVDVFVQLILHVGTSPASRAVRAVRFESILHAFLCSRLAQGNTLYRGCDCATRAEAHPCVAKMTIKCKERNSEARTSVKSIICAKNK